ncbi:AMP-binding protein [Desulfobacula sp.]|uniref:AMP-binding protein n=1 Tax=Desulfobacula sp. TaxID=2593537 RepID=UPI0026295FF9|nr:AMP-binding protein [Desulfobacula sp.]
MSYLDKPWLKSYKLGPYKLDHSLAPYPEEPLFNVLDNAAKKYPAQTAILFLKRTITYKDLKIYADKLANALTGLGVKKGDKVCVFLPNCPEAIIADWGILKTGAAAIPTSILRTDDGLVHEAGSGKAKVLICREDQLTRVLNLKEKCRFSSVIVTSKEGFDIEPVEEDIPDGVYEFRQLLEDSEAIPPDITIDPKNNLCELAFTGGATGVPKGVMITHFNRACCIRMGLPWMMKPMIKGIQGKSSILLPVPLFHSYGRYMSQSAAYLGMRLILMPDPRDIEFIVETIKEYRPFMITAVPTQFMRIAQKKVGRINAIPMSGAAPLPKDVADSIKDELGNPVSEGYGLTETGPLTHFNISGFSKITGFMLKEKTGLGVPAPDTECKIIDQDTGEETPFGEPGEILVKGPQVMKGYWPETGSGLTKDGWLKTGDIAYMDEDGYFHMTDRIKDMINVSGNKVYSTQVDEVIFKHPAVLMAASFGVPDPKIPGSERIAAVIKLHKDYPEIVTEDDIRSFCREHLAPYAVPKFVEFRDELPMTVTEKLFKKVLRDEVIDKISQKKNQMNHIVY